MKVRDYFAGMAMQAYIIAAAQKAPAITNENEESITADNYALADSAYNMAAAMMQYREDNLEAGKNWSLTVEPTSGDDFIVRGVTNMAIYDIGERIERGVIALLCEDEDCEVIFISTP